MRQAVALTVLIALLPGCREQASPPPSSAVAPHEETTDREYLCRATGAPPALDGDLSDACWGGAEPSPVFYTLGPCPEKAASRMRVRFLCDGACLYVAVDAESRPGATPSAQAPRKRDDAIFNDDSVEIFLHTSPAARDYYHLMLNCDNAVLDAHCDPTGREKSPAGAQWNPDWTHATRKRPGGWSAEMAIPYKALGEAPPPQGFVWRVKVGANAPGFPHAMWPKNPTPSFHEPTCAGYLIFRDRNLLANGNLEGPVDDKGVPKGWSYAYSEKEGKGIIALSEEKAPEGKRCIRYEKTTPEMWFPQLWVAPFRIQPHSTYEYSLWVNCEKRFVMRHSLYDASGNRVEKHSVEQPSTKGYERRKISFRVEGDLPMLGVGIQLSQVAGVIWVDDVKVERVNGLEFSRRVAPEPHRYHRLEQLAARRPFKPYPLVAKGDMLQSERTIFRDTGTGAQIWRLADTPGGSTRHFYMEVCPWSCDGSKILLYSSDWDKRFDVLFPADAASAKMLPIASGCYTWDRKDPDRFYYCKGVDGGKSAAFCYSLKENKEILLKTFDGDTNVWPISQDNKYLLVRESFPNAPWNQRSKIHLLSLDGKEDVVLDPKGQIHQLWFTKLPDHSVEFEYEHGGYQPGQYPEGNFMMTKDGAIKLIFGGEGRWAGHRAHSPSGRWLVPGGRFQRVDKLTGDILPLGDAGGNHQSWETDDSWLAASSDPHLVRVAADGRGFVHRIGSHNSAIGHSTYWTEAHPAMSPDGTKLGYASSMLGDINFYFIVMMPPGRPEGLTARAAEGKVALTWRAPKHGKEILGYLVWRSQKSGGSYEQIAMVTASDCAAVDAPPAKTPFYYAVSSLERSGLESLKSNEVCSDPSWPGPVRHVFEAEFAPVTKPPAMEEFDTTASGLYGMSLGHDEPAKDFALPFSVPREGKYSLRLRLKSPDNDFVLCSQTDGGARNSHAGKAGDWRWEEIASGAALARGDHRLSLLSNVPYVSIDQLVVTDDAAARPSGIEGADTTAPPPPTGLSARAEGSYSVRVEWKPVECPDLHHYNLYVSDSADCEVKQENLIASPSGVTYTDWGRLAGKSYSYRLTAVDRAGNESAPTGVASASTPTIPKRFLVTLDKKWRTKETPEAEVAFDCPEETDIVIWTKWCSYDSKGHGTKGSLRVAIDGKSLGDSGIRFGYICVGHGGPVPGHWLWNFSAPLTGDPGKERFGFRVGKGSHTVRLSAAKDSDMECGGVIVTNDFGFLPEGAYTSFLPMKEAGTKP